MNPFCANEDDYHHRVINHPAGLQEVICPGSDLHAFVWGHELDMHDAGRGGGNGSADLLLVDESGMVWLIEAKFDHTSEGGEFVWGSQLARYKDAIRRMPWQELLRYCAKFLRGLEKTKPAYEFPTTVKAFTDVLNIWHRHIGRALVEPTELNERIARHLRLGTYGIMVLTDIRDDTYGTCAESFLHDGPLAYVLGTPTADGMRYIRRWHRVEGTAQPTNDVGIRAVVDFDYPQPMCDPSTFAEGLRDESRQLWLSTLKPGIEKLGGVLTGLGKAMGFEARVSVSRGSFTLLLIGWPERDDRTVSRAEKLFGTASLRVDIHIKRLFEAAGRDATFVNRWMKRFYSRGWRGRPSRGMRERWGVIEVEAAELSSKIQGIMRYESADGVRCHNGRPGDRESLEGLLSDLKEMLDEFELRSRKWSPSILLRGPLDVS